MIEIKVDNNSNLSDAELLEKIYKKIPLWSWVKFNGNKYKRVTPKNNKVVKNPYHFENYGSIYNGNILITDKDKEKVNTICPYKVTINV